jgi:hypothetical protein
MKIRSSALTLLFLLTVSSIFSQAPATPADKKPSSTGTSGSTTPDPWIGIRFLLGSWESKTTGGIAQAKASAGYAFRLELHEHILARHSRSGACNAPDDFDCQHSDLLYLYPAPTGGALQAIYFDNEGHVIHYEVSAPTPNSVVLLSDPTQPGPQYRLSYELVGGVMSGKFELKMPGQGDFISYLEWSGKHR